MIPFFRKIRKKLADDNKPMKYMRYAIGEIALVVIGILIALQINTWDSENKREKMLKEHMINLKENLKEDLQNFQIYEDQLIFKYHGLQHILKLSGQKPITLNSGEQVKTLTTENTFWNTGLKDKLDNEFLHTIFLVSIRPQVGTINKSSIDELYNTGLYTLIKNQNIKDLINDYYTEADWRLGDYAMSQATKTRDNWAESLITDGILAQDILKVGNPLNLFDNNPERVGRLKAVIRITWWYSQSMSVLNEKALNLIELIEKEFEIQKD